ncbi:MAG: hypothetical protein KQH63_17030 [Desulfobulbaceae bacterium]|nr:hypothetical protein [Desulfobulbaceae bacterium]
MSSHRKESEKNYMANKSTATFFGIAAALGTFIGMWSMATLVSGFASVNWQISEVCRQYLMGAGHIEDYEAIVNQYCNINGIDYLLAGVCFAAFTAVYKYLNSEEEVTAAN